MSNRGSMLLNNSGGGLVGYVHTKEIIVSGMGGQEEIRIEPHWFRFDAGVGLFVTFDSGGAGDYDVEVTGARHDLRGTKPWNKHEILIGKTVNATGNLAYPCTGVRIFLRALTGNLWFNVVTTEAG